MAALLKKKNYNTTKGTKRWRKNIDASELEEQVVQTNKQKLIDQSIEETLKSKATIGFSIDVAGDQKLKVALAKDRFHKKIDESNISEQEMKKYYAVGRKLKKLEVIQKVQDAKRAIAEAKAEAEFVPVEQVWEQEEKSAPLIQPKKRIAHLVVPTSGMSYNPSFQEHQDVIDEAIAIEDEEMRAKTLEKVKKIRKKKKDQKEFERMSLIKKEKSLNDVQRAKKEERRIAHQANIIRKVKKEVMEEEKLVKASVATRTKQQENDRIVEEKLGFNFKPEKLGKKKFKQQGQDFVLEEDLPDNLRTIQPAGNLLRDEYNSVFRKGLLEPKNYFQKDKKTKVPAIRFKQKFDPYFKSEWDDVETALKVNE